jgi:hypothetical protein
VWGQLDNGKISGRNQLVKLAIRLLSIIANSAGCERLFSRMGIIHTKIKNRLHEEKVRKMSILGMEIRRGHAANGAVRKRLKRKFGHDEPEDESAPMPVQVEGNGEGITASVNIVPSDEIADDLEEAESPDSGGTFEEVAAGLAQDVMEDEDSDDEELPAATVEALQTAPRRVHLYFGAKSRTPLKNLFNYSDASANSKFGVFWKRGMHNLEKELELYSLLNKENGTESEEGLVVGSSHSIPIALDT